MKAIVAREVSPSLSELKVELTDKPVPAVAPGQCLIEVFGASVNSSDVRGLLGTMHKLVWPRTPGRAGQGPCGSA